MKELRDLVHGWIVKADSDLVAVRLLLEGGGPYDIACFHAQQAIEKLLKAVLAYRAQPIPRTHDLEELQRLVLAAGFIPGLEDLDLVEVTDYAVLARYDLSFWPDKETTAHALFLAEQARVILIAVLPEGYHP